MIRATQRIAPVAPLALIPLDKTRLTPDDMRDYGRQQYALGRARLVITDRMAQVYATQGWDAAQRDADLDAADATGYDDAVTA